MFRIRPRILTRRIRPLGRLGLEMVEEGVTDLDDILRERLGSLKLECDRARSALDRIRARHAAPTTFDPAALERFGRAMRENLTTGDIPFRKAGCGRSSRGLRSMTG